MALAQSHNLATFRNICVVRRRGMLRAVLAGSPAGEGSMFKLDALLGLARRFLAESLFKNSAFLMLNLVLTTVCDSFSWSYLECGPAQGMAGDRRFSWRASFGSPALGRGRNAGATRGPVCQHLGG